MASNNDDNKKDETTTTTTTEPAPAGDNNNDNNNKNADVAAAAGVATTHSNDFVIRDGFPALRVPPKNNNNTNNTNNESAPTVVVGTKPWIEGPEPLPRCKFWASPDAVEIYQADTLWEDCRRVFSARVRDDQAAYSAGLTYFLPAVMEPRCCLEKLVQRIYEYHVSILPPGSVLEEQSGAEWWTLVLDDDDEEDGNDGKKKKAKDSSGGTSSPSAAAAASKDNNADNNADDDDDDDEGDEVGMHFDADYGLEEQIPGMLIHPRVASVTYLSSKGAPTVILDRLSPPIHADPHGWRRQFEGPVTQAWIAHPSAGQHVAFDGRLLHGAPRTFFPALQDDDEDNSNQKPAAEPARKKQKRLPEQRITLLVNVWVNHCPLDAEPLDDDLVQQLQPVDANVLAWKLESNHNAEPPTTPSLTKVQLRPSPDDPAGEEEMVLSNRYVHVHYHASMDELHRATRAGGNLLTMEFLDESLTLRVGETVPEEEEEENE